MWTLFIFFRIIDSASKDDVNVIDSPKDTMQT